MNNNDAKTVWIQGHEFTVTNVTEHEGRKYFIGVCTENKVNDSIRHTGYNGGQYLLSPRQG